MELDQQLGHGGRPGLAFLLAHPGEFAQVVAVTERVLAVAVGAVGRPAVVDGDERIARLLADCYGASLSTGTLQAIVAQGAAGLEPFLEEVRGQLAGSAVVHLDETGARAAGTLHWVHEASSETLTLYGLHERRGREGIGRLVWTVACAVALLLAGCGGTSGNPSTGTPEASLQTKIDLGALGFALDDFKSAAQSYVETVGTCFSPEPGSTVLGLVAR